MNEFIKGEEVFVRGWIIATEYEGYPGAYRVEMPGTAPSGPIIRRWVSVDDIIGVEKIRPDDPEDFSDELSEIMARMESLQNDLGELTVRTGGILRCGSCGTTESVLRRYWGTGWPKCCGYTMTWWTKKQIDEGKMPA